MFPVSFHSLFSCLSFQMVSVALRNATITDRPGAVGRVHPAGGYDLVCRTVVVWLSGPGLLSDPHAAVVPARLCYVPCGARKTVHCR